MATTSTLLRDPLLAGLLPELDRVPGRARAAVQGLPESAFRATPPGGGWSIAQVFEHLCIVDASYLDTALPHAIARARARRSRARPHRPSLVGRFITRMVRETSARRLPTLKAYRPLVVRPHVVETYLAGVSGLREEMLEADGLDLNTELAAPAAPILRINLGDLFTYTIAHAHRHLAQVERTRRALGA